MTVLAVSSQTSHGGSTSPSCEDLLTGGDQGDFFRTKPALSPSEVTPATEMGQLRQNFVLQSEAENEIYAGFLVSFSNQKPGMKFTPALFGFPFS